MRPFHDILALYDARKSGAQYKARCPVHDDHNPSLAIREGERGGVVFKCFAGCAVADILAAKGLTWQDVSPNGTLVESDIVATYPYTDERGTTIYETVRYEPKAFKVRRLTAPNTYDWHIGARHVLYRLATLLGAPMVYLVEGEKDADRLVREGLIATTNPFGAKSWRREYADQLVAAGVKHVIVLPDADDAGELWANRVTTTLRTPHTVVRLPGLPPTGKDVSDWLDAGHPIDELRRISEPSPPRLNPQYLASVTSVAAEGQRIAAEGVPWCVQDFVPAYGMLGFMVAYAKVGKSTFGLQLAAAVATGTPFLERPTKGCRVLIVAAEDPPEYTAWLARHLGHIPTEQLTFYRGSIQLNPQGIEQIRGELQAGGYGLVLLSSWQALIRSLIDKENENAIAARIVEHLKAEGVRPSGIPWIIDAHSGKGEDQSDDADPNQAMRGASAAPAAADYTLSLRYARGPFDPHRRLSGSGRFVRFEPLLICWQNDEQGYALEGNSKKQVAETDWKLIQETGALTTAPRHAATIARMAGFIAADETKGLSSARRRVAQALRDRPGIGRREYSSGKQMRVEYFLSPDEPEG
jgi:AAA domain-containing protein